MSISVTCACGKQLNAREDAAGKRIRCPYCDKVLQVPVPILETSDYAIQALSPDLDGAGPMPLDDQSVAEIGTMAEPDPHRTKKQYKILTKKDPWFAGTFHPNDLEEALNAYAMQGWTLHSIFPTKLPNGESEEVIVVLER